MQCLLGLDRVGLVQGCGRHLLERARYVKGRECVAECVFSGVGELPARVAAGMQSIACSMSLRLVVVMDVPDCPRFLVLGKEMPF